MQSHLPGPSGAWGAAVPGGRGNAGRAIGATLSCGQVRPSASNLHSLWRLKKTALDEPSPGVPFRTQDFLPDPSRPGWDLLELGILVRSVGARFSWKASTLQFGPSLSLHLASVSF